MESTKSALGDEKSYGAAAFVDVSQALAAAGRMPTLRIDGPYGAHIPQGMTEAVNDFSSQAHRLRTSSSTRVRPLPAIKSFLSLLGHRFAVAILIGLGIGVTPFASILKNIWCQKGID